MPLYQIDWTPSDQPLSNITSWTSPQVPSVVKDYNQIFLFSIFDTSATDGLITSFQSSNGRVGIELYSSYYSTNGGHVSAWYMPLIGATNQTVTVNLGGTVTDFSAVSISISGFNYGVDFIYNTVATGNGSPSVTFDAIKPDGIYGFTTLTDQADATKLVAGLANIAIFDLGSDSSAFEYGVTLTSGNETHTVTDNDNDEDYIAMVTLLHDPGTKYIKGLLGSQTDTGSLTTVKNPPAIDLDFEDNDLDVLDSQVGFLFIQSGGLNSTNYKLSCSTFELAGGDAYGVKSLDVNDRFTFRAYFDIDSFTFASNDEYFSIFRITTDGTYNGIATFVDFVVYRSESVNELRIYWKDDDDSSNLLGTYSLSAGGAFKLEFQMQAESADGQADGTFVVKMNGSEILNSSTLDNYNIFPTINNLYMGNHLNYDIAGNYGTVYVDEIIIVRSLDWIDSTGTLYYQSASGSETNSGIVKKKPIKNLSGSQTDSGSIFRKIFKYLSGSELDSGNIFRKIFELLSGSETSTGIATYSKRAKQLLLGSETPTGEIFKSMFKFLLGDMNSSGNITKKISIFLSGLESSSGVLFLLIKKALFGSFDSSGTINSIKSIFYSLSGSMDSSGDISKKMFEALSGSMDSSGDISKKMFEALSGSFNSSGIINTLKLANKFYQSLSGSMDSSGDLYKLVQKLLSGTEISSGEIYRKIYKSLDGLFNSDGLVIKKMYEAFSGDQTDSGDITRRIVKLLLGSFDSSGEIFRVIKKIISGTQSSAGNVYKKIFLTLLGSFNSSGIVSAIKQAGIYYRSFSGSMDSSGDIRRSINKILLGASTFSGDISKKMFKFLFGDETSFGEISKRMSKYLSGILPSSGEILKKTYKNIFGDYTDSGSISKKVFEYLSGQLDSSGIITPIKLSARYYQSLFGSMDSSGSISRVIFKTVIGDSSFNGTISKKIFEFLSGSMNSSGLLNAIKGAVIYYQSLAGSMDSVGTITKTVSKTLVSISNFSGNIKRKVFKFVFGEGDFSGNIVRKIFKSLFGDTDFYGDISILRKFYILLSGTFSPTGETSKKSKKFLLGMSTFGGSIYKKISKLLNGIQSFIGVFTYYLAGERQYGTGILSLSKAQEALLSMTSSSAMDMEITKLEIEDNTFVDVEGDYDLSNITFEKINQSLITMSVSNSMSMAITKLEIEDDTFVTYEGDYVFSSITFEKINQILLTMNMKNNTKIIMAKLEIEGD